MEERSRDVTTARAALRSPIARRKCGGQDGAQQFEFAGKARQGLADHLDLDIAVMHPVIAVMGVAAAGIAACRVRIKIDAGDDEVQRAKGRGCGHHDRAIGGTGCPGPAIGARHLVEDEEAERLRAKTKALAPEHVIRFLAAAKAIDRGGQTAGRQRVAHEDELRGNQQAA